MDMDTSYVTKTVQTTREDHLIAWLAALAITIHIAESVLPSPLPGVKPGLANTVTLLAFLLYGWRIAAWVAVLRVLVGSLIIGSFLSPTFILSLSGSICSVLMLLVAGQWSKHLPHLRFGAIGYSVLAAFAHMVGQFWMAYWLFVPHAALFHLLPVLMTMAMIFGIVSGYIADTVIRRLEPQNERHINP